MKFVRQEPRTDRKILRNHRQDGNVAVGGFGNLASLGTSAVSEITNNPRVLSLSLCVCM